MAEAMVNSHTRKLGASPKESASPDSATQADLGEAQIAKQENYNLSKLEPENILYLQRTCGNQAVLRMLGQSTSQRKMIQRQVKIKSILGGESDATVEKVLALFKEEPEKEKILTQKTLLLTRFLQETKGVYGQFQTSELFKDFSIFCQTPSEQTDFELEQPQIPGQVKIKSILGGESAATVEKVLALFKEEPEKEKILTQKTLLLTRFLQETKGVYGQFQTSELFKDFSIFCQSATEETDFDFKQTDILGKEVCYGLCLSWLNQRAKTSSSANIKNLKAETPLANEAVEFQKQYIVNEVGKGKILDELNIHFQDIQNEADIGKHPSNLHSNRLTNLDNLQLPTKTTSQIVGRPLDDKAVWEKKALAFTRKKIHESKHQSGDTPLKPGFSLQRINFDPKYLENRLNEPAKHLLEQPPSSPYQYAIIVLDGKKGGHAIAVHIDGDRVFLFDPDLKQAAFSKEEAKTGISKHIAYIQTILDLHSIEVETFKKE
jgi:hypothetical protein